MVLAMLQKIEKYLSINLEVLLLYIKNLITFINITFKFKYLIMTFYWDVYTPYLTTLYIRQSLLLLACPIDSGCPGF
jgi:hypothetical protein